MPGETKIEWTRGDDGTPGRTWNPVTGCTRVSAGFDHCYAKMFAERFRGVPGHPYEQGFDLKLWPERLAIPLRWTKPRRIFANSMSDLWHADVPDAFIAEAFAVMALALWHTFQVLTKRPRRMQRLLSDTEWLGGVAGRMQIIAAERGIPSPGNLPWPILNVWLGVSVENQEAAFRIDYLLRTPAAVRFLSCEPLIGPLDLSAWLLVNDRTDGCISGCSWGTDHRFHYHPYCETYGAEQFVMPRLSPLHWVIVGGESGPGHRRMDPEWPRLIRDQSAAAGVPFFFKQWGGVRSKAGGRELDGRTWDEFPAVAS